MVTIQQLKEEFINSNMTIGEYYEILLTCEWVVPVEVLHIHGFPSDIVPAINKYNQEHPGPDGNAINITQTCIDALRKELKKREHPLQSMTCIPNVGPVELKRAADLIKGMGSRPRDAESDDRAQTIGTDESFWLCPVCLELFTSIEYIHLTLNGRCDECDAVLEQYEKVILRLDL